VVFGDSQIVRKEGSALSDFGTSDDICWIWSKRASSTNIVASLYRLAMVPFHLV
jgi:hypothetical protein